MTALKPAHARLPTEIPAEVLASAGGDLDLLLDYQKRLLSTTAHSALTVVEKSRRIGFTWAVAADAVLTSAATKAAGGMDTLYIGFNLDMAREFIDTAGAWARLFDKACSAIQEFIFKDGPDQDILAFRITFASGYEIMALASRPRSLRGRQGYVIIDEAAFHEDLDEVLKAALALLIWGGKVLVISTHDGASNPYNLLIEDIRAKKRPGELLRVTFDDALADGLYRRICQVQGKPWSAEAETAWRQSIVDFYGDGANEELFCIPRAAGGKYLPRSLVEACASEEVPVLRWKAPAGFVDQPDHIRQAEVREWCERHLLPLLLQLDANLLSCFGLDFAMSGDLTVFWPLQILKSLVRRAPFVVELAGMPVEEQRLVLCYVVDRLPRFFKGAMDAGGNGAALAQRMRQIYGPERILEIKFSTEWYRANMPPFKAALEGRSFVVPKDANVIADFGLVEMTDGVAKVPKGARTKGTDGQQRHGDSAIAGVLADFASRFDAAEYDYRAAGAGARRHEEGADRRHDEDRDRRRREPRGRMYG